MTKRRSRIRGFSMMETLVVLSIVATVAALALPDIAKSKRDVYVFQCKAQMQEIGVALIKYRDEHQGKIPNEIGALVPRYIEESKLVCPLTQRMAPEAVKAWQEYCRKVAEPPSAASFPGIDKWTSYLYVSPYWVDMHHKNNPTRTPFSHADLLRRRGNETPMLICRDHREPFSLDDFLGLPEPRPVVPSYPKVVFPLWDYPEDDIVVLRWNGEVTTTKKGGSKLQRTFVSTSADQLEL